MGAISTHRRRRKLYSHDSTQSAERWGLLNKRRTYMIPVRPPSMPKPDIQQVSPVVAEQERAVSELNETMHNDEPHMPLKKSIKRRKKRAPTRRSWSTKGKRRLTRKKKQGRRRINSLRKNLKKKKTLKAKRKTKKRWRRVTKELQSFRKRSCLT